ncbi:hypothetical protein [Streptomyces sp. NPDC093089]|uniref:hypothetical protein n=1 Tax=Streptomyces sp. NPDC093089 TaxID=3366024 RepID=UPI0038239502
MSPLQAGVATLPAAAGIVVTAPLITRFVDRLGARTVIASGFAVATAAFVVFAFVDSSWKYATFVVPLVVLAVGLGLALLVGRIRPIGPPTAVHYAAAAAASSHTVPTRPTNGGPKGDRHGG